MLIGLLGKNLTHSFSREIHNLIDNYDYKYIEVSESDFDDFIMKKDFFALNITMPYKEKIIKYLDYIDDLALKINAVNVVVNIENKLYGYNSDYYGLKALIEKSKIDIKDKKVLILGTGGTSKTAYEVVKTLLCKEVNFVSSSNKKNSISYEDAHCKYNDAQIIINTTPIGVSIDDELLIDVNKFDNLEGVIDVIYNPLNTKLIIESKKKGIKTATGLYMLVAQAIYANGMFFSKEVDYSLIDKIYEKVLKNKENIILIGMPTSGKSTIGKLLSTKLNKKFVDTDEEIEKIINSSIKDYIKKYGETAFRKIEREVVASVSKENNLVVATGGGVILDSDNMDLLSMNGKIIYLNRKLELLFPDESRPLSSSKEDLFKLYESRNKIYEKYADIVINNNFDIEKTINDLTEVLA